MLLIIIKNYRYKINKEYIGYSVNFLQSKVIVLPEFLLHILSI